MVALARARGVRAAARSKRTLAVVLLAMAAAAEVTLAGARLFAWPPVDRPTEADAVVVLAGGGGERVGVAVRLMERGVAPTLALIGEQTELEGYELCTGRRVPAFAVVCVRPDPDSTRTEARATTRLASARGWRRLVVVTSDYHVVRSRMLLDRCFSGTVQMVGAEPPTSIRSRLSTIVKEALGLLHATVVARGC